MAWDVQEAGGVTVMIRYPQIFDNIENIACRINFIALQMSGGL